VARESSAYATASALYWHVLLGGSKLREVEFVLYDKETFEVYIEELRGVFLGESDQGSDDDAAVGVRDAALEPTVEITSLVRPVRE
jgi:serine/threonine-protein kinase